MCGCLAVAIGTYYWKLVSKAFRFRCVPVEILKKESPGKMPGRERFIEEEVAVVRCSTISTSSYVEVAKRPGVMSKRDFKNGNPVHRSYGS